MQNTKNALFVRPNLKMFVVGAIVLLLINHIFTATPIQASARSIPIIGVDSHISADDFQRLHAYAEEFPGADSYYRLSYCYQKSGNYAKAMHYFQIAQRYDYMDY